MASRTPRRVRLSDDDDDDNGLQEKIQSACDDGQNNYLKPLITQLNLKVSEGTVSRQSRQATLDKALITAVQKRDYEMADILLQCKANPDTQHHMISKSELEDPQAMRCPLIHVAADHGDNKMVELLIDYDADSNCTDDDGWTPLAHAAYGGNTKTVRAILRNRVNVNSRFPRGHDKITSLMLASERGHLDTVKVRHDEFMIPKI